MKQHRIDVSVAEVEGIGSGIFVALCGHKVTRDEVIEAQDAKAPVCSSCLRSGK